MKKLLVAALLFASVLPAAAQTANTTNSMPPMGPPPAGQGQPPMGQMGGPMHGHEWSPECKAKIEKLCPDTKPGKGAIHDCLAKQNTTFAQVCPADAAAFKAEHQNHQQGQGGMMPPPPASGQQP